MGACGIAQGLSLVLCDNLEGWDGRGGMVGVRWGGRVGRLKREGMYPYL